MELPFAFSICPMFQREGVKEARSPKGRWKPPKAAGDNLKLTPAYFHFDGDSTRMVLNLPSGVVRHKTYSVYHDRGLFWTVDYDATAEQVNGGPEAESNNASSSRLGFEDDSASLVDDEGSSNGSHTDSDTAVTEKDEWNILNFDYRDTDGLSYAGRRQPFHRLYVRRKDQQWADKLLPDPCSARSWTDDTSHGGLIGELPLLIALIAFATPPTQLANGICQAIGRAWSAPLFERDIGWDDKRGMVITTYACPPHSDPDQLVRLERGGHGAIFK